MKEVLRPASILWPSLVQLSELGEIPGDDEEGLREHARAIVEMEDLVKP